MLDRHVAANPKVWDHDRAMTVGASEVGQCARKTWLVKTNAAPDADHVDRYGARLRGDLIEIHHWEPGIRSQLPEGVRFLFAGKDQKTLVDGYLSATSDGLLAGVSRSCLDHLGIADIGADCLVVECKSLDPRIDLKEAKAEHAFQVHCQMGLIRHCTEYQPEHALISYTDASFLDDVTEFAVPFDPDIYAAARTRATRIMTAEAALELPAEGKLAGGGECRYCPFRGRCAGVTLGAIPGEIEPLGDNAMVAFGALVDAEQTARSEKEAAGRRHVDAQERIRQFLREHRTRKVEGDDWSVTWFPVKGRVSLDRKAATAAGVDLSPFEKEGDPGERLTIKIKQPQPRKETCK
jgi:hypothetical protein